MKLNWPSANEIKNILRVATATLTLSIATVTTVLGQQNKDLPDRNQGGPETPAGMDPDIERIASVLANYLEKQVPESFQEGDRLEFSLYQTIAGEGFQDLGFEPGDYKAILDLYESDPENFKDNFVQLVHDKMPSKNKVNLNHMVEVIQLELDNIIDGRDSSPDVNPDEKFADAVASNYVDNYNQGSLGLTSDALLAYWSQSTDRTIPGTGSRPENYFRIFADKHGVDKNVSFLDAIEEKWKLRSGLCEPNEIIAALNEMGETYSNVLKNQNDSDGLTKDQKDNYVKHVVNYLIDFNSKRYGRTQYAQMASNLRNSVYSKNGALNIAMRGSNGALPAVTSSLFEKSNVSGVMLLSYLSTMYGHDVAIFIARNADDEEKVSSALSRYLSPEDCRNAASAVSRVTGDVYPDAGDPKLVTPEDLLSGAFDLMNKYIKGDPETKDILLQMSPEVQECLDQMMKALGVMIVELENIDFSIPTQIGLRTVSNNYLSSFSNYVALYQNNTTSTDGLTKFGSVPQISERNIEFILSKTFALQNIGKKYEQDGFPHSNLNIGVDAFAGGTSYGINSATGAIKDRLDKITVGDQQGFSGGRTFVPSFGAELNADIYALKLFGGVRTLLSSEDDPQIANFLRKGATANGWFGAQLKAVGYDFDKGNGFVNLSLGARMMRNDLFGNKTSDDDADRQNIVNLLARPVLSDADKALVEDYFNRGAATFSMTNSFEYFLELRAQFRNWSLFVNAAHRTFATDGDIRASLDQFTEGNDSEINVGDAPKQLAFNLGVTFTPGKWRTQKERIATAQKITVTDENGKIINEGKVQYAFQNNGTPTDPKVKGQSRGSLPVFRFNQQEQSRVVSDSLRLEKTKEKLDKMLEDLDKKVGDELKQYYDQGAANRAFGKQLSEEKYLRSLFKEGYLESLSPEQEQIALKEAQRFIDEGKLPKAATAREETFEAVPN